MSNLGGGDSLAEEAAQGEDLSLMPPQIKEIMIRLQSENKHLKEQSERDLNRSTNDKAELNEQIELLNKEKLALQEKVAELEVKVTSGVESHEHDSEAVQELQEKLKVAKEHEISQKSEVDTLTQNLNDANSKSEEFEALLKQKEEDIKVNKLYRYEKFALLFFL